MIKFINDQQFNVSVVRTIGGQPVVAWRSFIAENGNKPSDELVAGIEYELDKRLDDFEQRVSRATIRPFLKEDF